VKPNYSFSPENLFDCDNNPILMKARRACGEGYVVGQPKNERYYFYDEVNELISSNFLHDLIV
jgi:hypothetical protein